MSIFQEIDGHDQQLKLSCLSLWVLECLSDAVATRTSNLDESFRRGVTHNSSLGSHSLSSTFPHSFSAHSLGNGAKSIRDKLIGIAQEQWRWWLSGCRNCRSTLTAWALVPCISRAARCTRRHTPGGIRRSPTSRQHLFDALIWPARSAICQRETPADAVRRAGPPRVGASIGLHPPLSAASRRTMQSLTTAGTTSPLTTTPRSRRCSSL